MAAVLALTSACTGLLGLEPLRFDAAPEAGIDAAQDVTTTDVVDAGVDAASRCKDGLVHDFCSNFEGVTNVDQEWTNREVSANGGVELVEGLDGGQAARLHINTNTAATVPIARLDFKADWPRTASGAQPKAHAAFDLFLEQVDPAHPNMNVFDFISGQEQSGTLNGFEDAVAVFVTCGDAGTSCGLNVIESYVKDDAVAYSIKNFASLNVPLQQWVAVEVFLNERPAGTPGGGMVVTLDGASEAYGLLGSARVPYFRADFGLSNGSTAGGDYAIHLDNVRLDWLNR